MAISEFEALVRDELRSIRAGQEAMETGLNRVYAHLIHQDKTRSETGVVLAEIARHVANIHEVLIKHIEDETSRYDRLEQSLRSHIISSGNGNGEIVE